MRGHEHLIQVRRNGYAPEWVFIDLADPANMREWADWRDTHPDKASLLIEDSDVRPDMRCVAGLKVFIQGDDAARVHLVRDACIAVKAKRVIANVTRTHFSEFAVVETTDTAGIENYCEAEHGQDA